jgi:hypothetical protein
MKSNVSWMKLAVVLAAIVAFNMPPRVAAQDGKQCSAANVAGKWGFTISGTIPSIGPVGAVGIFTQDSSGNITGTETRSLNGDVADETLTGTATVNADCSGTDTFQVFESGVLVRTSVVNVIYDSNRREARAVFTSVVLPDGTSLPSILTVEANRLFVKD